MLYSGAPENFAGNAAKFFNARGREFCYAVCLSFFCNKDFFHGTED